MTIDKDFLKVDQLKSLEHKTFIYFNNCKATIEDEGFADFTSKVSISSSALNGSKKRNNVSINFQSYFDLNLGKRQQRFHVGSLIQNDYSQVTYYLAICDYDVTASCCKILRKFHFDYDIGTGKQKKLHPKFHFQYAGEKPTGMDDHGEQYETVLSPWLSEPRLPYAPMSLALLLNCIFVEFSTEITTKITEDDIWRDLVKTNETELLKPYYRNCWNLFNGPHSSKNLFTTDYCYGK